MSELKDLQIIKSKIDKYSSEWKDRYNVVEQAYELYDKQPSKINELVKEIEFEKLQLFINRWEGCEKLLKNPKQFNEISEQYNKITEKVKESIKHKQYRLNLLKQQKNKRGRVNER